MYLISSMDSIHCLVQDLKTLSDTDSFVSFGIQIQIIGTVLDSTKIRFSIKNFFSKCD